MPPDWKAREAECEDLHRAGCLEGPPLPPSTPRSQPRRLRRGRLTPGGCWLSGVGCMPTAAPRRCPSSCRCWSPALFCALPAPALPESRGPGSGVSGESLPRASPCLRPPCCREDAALQEPSTLSPPRASSIQVHARLLLSPPTLARPSLLPRVSSQAEGSGRVPLQTLLPLSPSRELLRPGPACPLSLPIPTTPEATPRTTLRDRPHVAAWLGPPDPQRPVAQAPLMLWPCSVEPADQAEASL